MSFEAGLMLMTDALFAETQISFECLFSICLTTTIPNNTELDHIFCLICTYDDLLNKQQSRLTAIL